MATIAVGIYTGVPVDPNLYHSLHSPDMSHFKQLGIPISSGHK